MGSREIGNGLLLSNKSFVILPRVSAMGMGTAGHPDQLPLHHEPPCCRPRRLWSFAFYAPAVAWPLAARLLVLARDGADLGLASALKGAAFGAMQDAAVFLQTLVAVRAVLDGSRRGTRLLPESSLAHGVVRGLTALALGLLYAWLTLACAVDLTLLLRFLPRLNRGFVHMYMQFSSQFASSLEDVVTPPLVLGALMYIASMTLWVTALLGDKMELPRFALLVCESPAPSTRTDPAKQPDDQRQRRPSVIAQEAGLFPYAVHTATSSVAFRTAFVALLVFASALHATLALDGNGNDIYLLSNAMFSLETEGFLRASTRTQLSATDALHAQHSLLNALSPANSTDAEDDSTLPPLSPFYERTIGRNEVFESPSQRHGDKYPFWRKTVRFTGEKRFEWPTRTDRNEKPPPTVLLLNLESFRSREVGVLGGRANVARYNQTVTPFFDSLAKSGVLFANHYTPCVQTSRTLLSSLFGVLPSVKDASAVATFPETKLRLYGLPHILKQALNYTSTFWSAVNLAWEDWRGFLLANGFDVLVDDVKVLDFLSKARRAKLTDDDAFSWGRHDPVSFEALANFLRLHQRRLREDPANTQPLFIDAYTVSSHDPWKLPVTFQPSTNYSSYLTSDNEKYVHSLNFVDQCLEKFITTLRRKGLLNNTIVLIEGDHGYGRMEHGNNPTVVASSVYDEGTHVPMLLLADDFLAEKDKGRVVDDLTSQTDLLATITDMLGIGNFMQHGLGQSMLRKRDPRHAGEREVVLTNPFYGQTRGLRVGRDLKYARYGTGKYEVYNLSSDPLELAPIETGKLSKTPDGGVHIGTDLHPTTAEALRFMEQVVDVVSLLYETNAFVPLPSDVVEENERSSASGVTQGDDELDAAKKKILDIVHQPSATTTDPSRPPTDPAAVASSP